MAVPVDSRSDTPSPWQQRWAILTKCLLLMAVGLVAVLIVSGAVLSVTYRPSAADAWPDLEAIGVGAPDQLTRSVHRTASTVLFPVAVAGCIAAIGWAATAKRRSWLGGLALVASAAASGITGFLLAFDQVALWAVTVGTNVEGVWWVASDPAVRFVIIDGSEVSQTSYRNALIAHLLLTAGVVASIVGVGWTLRRRTGRPDDLRAGAGAATGTSPAG